MQIMTWNLKMQHACHQQKRKCISQKELLSSFSANIEIEPKTTILIFEFLELSYIEKYFRRHILSINRTEEIRRHFAPDYSI